MVGDEKMQLNYHAYMNQSGYSVAASDYLFSLLSNYPDINIKLHLINKKLGDGISSNRKQILGSLEKKERTEPSIDFYHCIPPRYRRQKGVSKHIGFCVFETINPPKNWVEMMNNMDSIVTASHFNKNTFAEAGVKVPISVVPHCFDARLFNKNVKNSGRYGRTTFISIGTWKKRKNWEMLIRGWYEAFENKHNVCLLIKTDKPNELKAMVQQIKQNSDWRAKNTAPIYCEEKVLVDFEDIPSLLRKGDIYVSASIGEGFALPVLHAMAMGIPVLTTRFGGVLEYAKPELCNYFEPLRYITIPLMDNIPQLTNCIWPYISIKEIAQKMQKVLFDIKDREIKAERAYEYVHANLTYNPIAKKMFKAIWGEIYGI